MQSDSIGATHVFRTHTTFLNFFVRSTQVLLQRFNPTRHEYAQQSHQRRSASGEFESSVIHGRTDWRGDMKAVHDSATMDLPTSVNTPRASTERGRKFVEVRRRKNIETASAADRIKLFSILLCDLFVCACALAVRSFRTLLQRLADTFNNRT